MHKCISSVVSRCYTSVNGENYIIYRMYICSLKPSGKLLEKLHMSHTNLHFKAKADCDSLSLEEEYA